MEVGDNLDKHPQCLAFMAEELPLITELKESFVHAGGTNEDWRDIIERPNLPDWHKDWSGVTVGDYVERLADMAKYYMKPGTLIEVEVKESENQEPVGVAILQIREVKNPKSNWAARVRFVASDSESFTDWGVLHFDDLQDFEVHFCKKAGCSLKPPAKTYGYFHVCRLRLLPVSEALKLGYGNDEVISVFSDYLQDMMSEALTGEPGHKKNEEPQDPGGGSDAEARAKRAAEKAQPAVDARVECHS